MAQIGESLRSLVPSIGMHTSHVSRIGAELENHDAFFVLLDLTLAMPTSWQASITGKRGSGTQLRSNQHTWPRT